MTETFHMLRSTFAAHLHFLILCGFLTIHFLRYTNSGLFNFARHHLVELNPNRVYHIYDPRCKIINFLEIQDTNSHVNEREKRIKCLLQNVLCTQNCVHVHADSVCLQQISHGAIATSM